MFLAVLPIGVLENAELITLLRRLGIRSLGDFPHWPPVMCSLASAGKAHYSIAWRAD